MSDDLTTTEQFFRRQAARPDAHALRALLAEYDRRGQQIAELERDLADAQAILRTLNRKFLAGGQ